MKTCKEIVSSICDIPYKIDIVLAFNDIDYVVAYYVKDRIEAITCGRIGNYRDHEHIKENINNLLKNGIPAATEIDRILNNPKKITHVY